MAESSDSYQSGDFEPESSPAKSPRGDDDSTGWGLSDSGDGDPPRTASDESSVWSPPPSPSSAGSGPRAAVPWTAPASSSSSEQ